MLLPCLAQLSSKSFFQAALPALAERELNTVAKQYPFEPPVFKALRLTFEEGIKLLQENGYPDVSASPDSPP